MRNEEIVSAIENEDVDEFSRLNSVWDSSAYASIDVAASLAGPDLTRKIIFLTSMRDLNLSQAIMSELADMSWISPDDETLLFDHGDVGVKCAICMRPNLKAEILERCIKSDSKDVICAVAFNPLVSVARLVDVLRKTKLEEVRNCIDRAIRWKRGQ